MNKGDIFLINFYPSVGSEFQKVRPSVILQSSVISSNLITVMPISSKTSKIGDADIFLKKDEKNRLFCDSVIKVTQISSFDRKRFLHFVGRVDRDIISQIDSYLKQHLDI